MHAGAGRLQATVAAGLALAAAHGFFSADVVDAEVGIPRVIAGRLTHDAPPDLQSAQLSVPFSLAVALALGATRGARAGLRREDYEAALASADMRSLARRVRCVVDPEIEAATNTEEVPSRVKITLADGRVLETREAHPRGSPQRRTSWEELCALFYDTVGDALPRDRLQRVPERVSALDRDARPGEIVAAFVAAPGSWNE